ncbi:MAG: hypothetical protein R3B84_03395 [Zavarzinella sp.]
MLLIDSKPLTITTSRSKLAFTTTGGTNWKVWDRFISLGDEQLFHIGNICGTCEFFFRRMTEAAVPSFEIERVKTELEVGISAIDPTAATLAEIMPNGKYVVALFECQPNQAGTDSTPDYFSHEQRLAWPDYDDDPSPETWYYRGDSTAMPDQQMLFEFYVPLYDSSLLNNERVEYYKSVIKSGSRPTAISLSVLDVKAPMSFPEDEDGNEIEPEFRTHWCFANYLLDGHHKVFASHSLGIPITILSFISIDHSWQQIDKLIAHYHDQQINKRRT